MNLTFKHRQPEDPAGSGFTAGPSGGTLISPAGRSAGRRLRSRTGLAVAVTGTLSAAVALTAVVASVAGASTAVAGPSHTRTAVLASAAIPATHTKGCAAGGVAIPKGAGRAKGADLDGDGKADTIWLNDTTHKNGSVTRTLGVRTASGAGFSTTFSNAAPESDSAVAGRLGDGTPVILLDSGRAAYLYTVKSCRIDKSLNAQGSQYTFDRQLLTGYGTGAGCPVIGKTGRHLVGYKATPNNSHATSYTVRRTTIVLTKGGTQARNGATVTLGRHLSPTSSTVRTAQAVSCGANPKAFEPSE